MVKSVDSKGRTCLQGLQVKPEPQPARRGTKRKAAASTSGLMDMVPSDLSFKQQMQQALRQSQREEAKRIRQSLGQRTLHVTSTVVSQMPLKLDTSSPKQRRHQRTQCTVSDSEDLVTSDSVHAVHLQASPCALSEVYSSDTVLDEEFQSEDLVDERAEKVELEGFSICASGAAPGRPSIFSEKSFVSVHN